MSYPKFRFISDVIGDLPDELTAGCVDIVEYLSSYDIWDIIQEKWIKVNNTESNITCPACGKKVPTSPEI